MQIKRLKILKTLTIAMTCIPLLTSCSGWFKPRTMTIEYDEEVKLHDGSMIWVHITRHYFYTSEPAHGGAYMPSKVEISWDTGFEGVGRKSVFFSGFIGVIDKFNGKWFVAGAKNKGSFNKMNHSTDCNQVGIFIGTNSCIVSIDKSGKFIKPEPKEIYNFNVKNILNPTGIKDWGLFPEKLNNHKLTLQEKLDLQRHQVERRQQIGKPYLTN